MIVTGAPASGKTVAASTLRLPTTEIVHEVILTSPDKASRIVREALHAKRVPRITLFYTEDPRLNVRRMILRAKRIGRTVPLAFMAKAYSGIPRIVRDLSGSTRMNWNCSLPTTQERKTRLSSSNGSTKRSIAQGDIPRLSVWR